MLPHHSPHLRSPDRQAIAVLLVSGSLAATGAVVSYAVRQVQAAFRGAEAMRVEAVNALSHDLKNPLHVVLGYASLLEGASAEEREEFAGSVLEAADRALALVRGGLDVSAWQEGVPPAPRLAPVRLNDLVAQTAARFRLAAAERQLRVVTHLEPSLPAVDADAELIERALANLISNGIKYGVGGGMVEVSTTHGGGHVAVSVRDEGKGLAPGEQARLFQPFSRSSTGRGVEGTGLGLYIVRTIVEAHGGSVRVDSAVGRGSTFTIELPACRS
jgi:signal transduction histidine kinase